MENINHPKEIYLSISEMTLNLMKRIGYKIRNCELFLFNNTCYKVDQKCLNKFEFQNYFLYYTIDDINKRWICYVKNEDNFKKKTMWKYLWIIIKIK